MAGEISFSGLGSSIDFSVITDAIIASRSRPMIQLTARQSDYRGRADALRQLNASLIALKDAAAALMDRSTGTGLVASSSSTGVASPSVTTGAVAGTLTLEVVRLASNLSQASSSFPSPDSPILANGATSATFELRKGGATSGVEISIDSTNDSLAGLRDAINSAAAGVTASIVDVAGDGTQNQLVLISTDTGSAGRVELVETTATGTGAALDLRTINPASESFADLDAQIKINGLSITRPSNTISDAVSGVTFSLAGTGLTSITVSPDSGALKSKIAAFVDAYNEVQEFISSQFKPDAEGKPGGILSRDSTLRAVSQSLRGLIEISSSDNGGTLTSLSQIGITRNDTGKLEIDQDVLNEKLKTSLGDVRALFAGATENETGLASSLQALASDLSSNVEVSITGFDSSIERMGKSIEAHQARLDALRASLTRQFAAADAAIGQLNGQGTALTNILESLKPRSER